MEILLIAMVIVYGLFGFAMIKWSERENANLKERNIHLIKRQRAFRDENDTLNCRCQALLADRERDAQTIKSLKNEIERLKSRVAMRFKVGDKVMVREWDDMLSEFGLADLGKRIGVPDFGIDVADSTFTIHMKSLCGKPAIVKEIEDGYCLLSPMIFCDEAFDWDWHFPDEVLMPYKEQ